MNYGFTVTTSYIVEDNIFESWETGVLILFELQNGFPLSRNAGLKSYL